MRAINVHLGMSESKSGGNKPCDGNKKMHTKVQSCATVSFS